MIFWYPVLIEKKENAYYGHVPGVDCIPTEDSFGDSVDEVMDNMRLLLAEYLYEHVVENKEKLPIPNEVDFTKIENEVVFVRLVIDTDEYKEQYVEMERYNINPFLNEGK